MTKNFSDYRLQFPVLRNVTILNIFFKTRQNFFFTNLRLLSKKNVFRQLEEKNMQVNQTQNVNFGAKVNVSESLRPIEKVIKDRLSNIGGGEFVHTVTQDGDVWTLSTGCISNNGLPRGIADASLPGDVFAPAAEREAAITMPSSTPLIKLSILDRGDGRIIPSLQDAARSFVRYLLPNSKDL